MGDFGIAKVLDCTAGCAQTQIGTPYYLSPEICQGKSYAWSSDIWSMGCILYEICARAVPFDAPDLRSLIQKITRGPTPEMPAEYSSGLRILCKEMLERDPSKRPPAGDILKRPVIQGMVKRMFEDLRPEESATKEPKEKGSSASDLPKAAASPSPKLIRGSASGGKYAANAGNYTKGDDVEYYSETHGEWLPAAVTDVNAEGRIIINVKPNVWMSRDVQSAKVRPRQAGSQRSQAQQPQAQAERASAAQRGSAAAGAPPRASDQRESQSDRRMLPPGTPDQPVPRGAGRDGFPPGGQAARQQTPSYERGASGDAGHRGGSQDRRRSREAASPFRGGAGPPRMY